MTRHTLTRITVGKYPQQSYELRSFDSESDLKMSQHYVGRTPGHVKPNSVLIATIGTNWEAGSWQKVVDMVKYTNERGVTCWLLEIPDRCICIPYQNVNYMKNLACTKALDQGFEWLMVVDNDVLPEPDMLLKLMNWGAPIVAPYIYDPKEKNTLFAPRYEKGKGLRPVTWSIQSCMLFWTKVFNCFPVGQPWADYTVECDLSDAFRHYGHTVFVDTNTELKLATYPTYHGGCETLPELMNFYEKADVRRKKQPDRTSLDKKDTSITYLPEGWKEDKNGSVPANKTVG